MNSPGFCNSTMNSFNSCEKAYRQNNIAQIEECDSTLLSALAKNGSLSLSLFEKRHPKSWGKRL